jgi:hypothetical protein
VLAFSVIQRGTKGRVHFGFTKQDIERKSLGQLVRTFEKYNSNAKLIGDLKPLPKQRNFIAHQAYLLSAQRAIDEIAGHIVKVRYAHAGAVHANEQLLEEAQKMVELLEASSVSES